MCEQSEWPFPSDRSLVGGDGQPCDTHHSISRAVDMRSVGFAALFVFWRLHQAGQLSVPISGAAGRTVLSAAWRADVSLAEALAGCQQGLTSPGNQIGLSIVSSGATVTDGAPVPRLEVASVTDRTWLSLVHDPAVLAPVSAQDLLEKICIVLDAMAEAPSTLCGDLELVTATVRTLIPDLSRALPAKHFDPVAATFFEVAHRHAAEPAVSDGQRIYSYADLSRAVRYLTARLGHAGLQPQDIVAIRGQACFGVYAAMLAVLAAGGALVTLDRSLPPDRQALIGRISQPRLRIDVGGPTVLGAPNTIEIPEWPSEEELARLSDEPERVVTPAEGATAYVFFTSGSSGTPKGVQGTHLGLAHFLSWQREAYPLGPGDRMAQLIALSFDPVLRDVLYPLTSGACVHVPAREMLLDARRMMAWFARHRIGAMHCVPSLMKAWMQARPEGQPFQTMRYAFFNGEPLNDRLLRAFTDAAGPAVRIVNLYGPTETTLAKLSYEVDRIEPGVQPVGRPQPGVDVVIIRDRKALCGLWEVGEIAIRTPYRSRGYLGSPELTAQVFVANPWRGDSEDLIYFTGDLGRVRSDGAVEIFGRRDAQIKIHGVRFEPNEIETALLGLPGVRDAAVSVREAGEGEKLLVGFIVPEERSGATDPTILFRSIRSALRMRVVDAMIPGRFVLIDVLPQLPNGKLDRQALKALPAPPEGRSARRHIADEKLRAFVTGLEELLGVQIDDTRLSFLDLGGDSLSYIRASMLIEDIFGDLPDGWENRPLASFVTRPGIADAPVAATADRRGSGMETSLLLRAVAIILIVLGHSSFSEMLTATSTLFVISGMQFSRFLRPAIRTSGNLRPTLNLIRRFALPAILWQVPRAIWLDNFWWPTFLMMGTFIQHPDQPLFTAWYLDVLAADLLIFAGIGWMGYRLFPASRTVTDSFRSDLAWVVVGLAVAAAQVLSGWWDGTVGTDSVAPFKWLWMLSFGMLITQATSVGRQLIVSALLLGLAVASGITPVQSVLYKVDASFFVMTALLVWVPRVRLPRRLHEATMTIASATLFIYLLNHSVMTHLMPMLRIPPWWPLQVGLSIATGIAAKYGWDHVEMASRWVWARVPRWGSVSDPGCQVVRTGRDVVATPAHFGK